LHGNNPPNILCLIPGKVVNGRMQPRKLGPYTSTVGCTGLIGVQLVIKSISNGTVCFTGHGYLPIRLDGVYDIFTCYSGGCSSGWVRYYNGGLVISTTSTPQ